jgi:hypothetical protein
MTKSITITYNEADESVLMSIFKKFKVKTVKTAPVSDDDDEEVSFINAVNAGTYKTAPVSDDDDEEGVPMEVALQMVESLEWIKKSERGEVEPMGSFEDLIAELKAEELEVEPA